ncbi:MAG: HAD family phosphatase [Candidatus Brocadiia bacterium]|jgi:putative hydrolase of the HAD superfamily
MASRKITWILFDLGNVLIELHADGLGRAAAALGSTPERLVALFNESGMAQAIALGKLSPQEFVEQINRRFGTSVAPADVVSWFGPELAVVFPEVPGLIASLKGHYGLAILSNTFFGHWDYFIAMDLARQFDALIASHLIGFCKPDPRAYRAALDRMGATAAETVFVDDLAENVQAARALGFTTFQSTTPAELIQGLQRAGVVCGGPPAK